jgi:hypothetical protein
MKVEASTRTLTVEDRFLWTTNRANDEILAVEIEVPVPRSRESAFVEEKRVAGKRRIDSRLDRRSVAGAVGIDVPGAGE